MTICADARLPRQRGWLALLLLCCAPQCVHAQSNLPPTPQPPSPQPHGQLGAPGMPGQTLRSAQVPVGTPALTWDQLKAEFLAASPILKQDQLLNVDEMKAEEVTAYLRPNPQFTISEDGTAIVPHNNVWQPTKGTYVVPTFSYLHERDHKRELRLESAKQGTQIGVFGHEDLTRNLLFTLRSAYVQTLHAKAVLDLAEADLEYYDKIIDVSRARFKAGDLAQIDLDRIELLRVQYETEIETAIVNLRTEKIQLLLLLNDRTAVDQFNVVGLFDFSEQLQPLDYFHQTALATRPDLQEAMETLQQSKTNHTLAVSNGSTDPTYSLWVTRNPSFSNPNDFWTLGLSVGVPLRVFDRNQGEKQRTLIDIDRSQELTNATTAQVFSDVDSSYEQLRSSISLL